jgi:hypothetical protein
MKTNRKNKNKGPEIKLQSYLIFDKVDRNIHCRKDSLFNKWCWENWLSTFRRLKLHLNLSPYTKNNSKWIKYPNIRPQTLKLM